MADVGIYTKNADIQALCPTWVSATSKAVAATDVYVLNVEAYINSFTRMNWSDYFASLNADVCEVLTECAAALCAINVIIWDMSAFPSRTTAEDALNVLNAIAMRDLAMLRDKATQQFIFKASGVTWPTS